MYAWCFIIGNGAVELDLPFREVLMPLSFPSVQAMRDAFFPLGVPEYVLELFKRLAVLGFAVRLQRGCPALLPYVDLLGFSGAIFPANSVVTAFSYFGRWLTMKDAA